jgi:hypothetical protein
MKRCPACQRTYTDDQNFCLDDGTTLLGVIGGSYDPSEAPTNYPYRGGAAPTELMQGVPTSGGAGAARTTPPPPQFMTPYPQKRSKAILWFVLGGVVLIAGIITAVLLANRKSGTTTSGGYTSPSPSSSPTYTPSSSSSSSSSWQTVNGDSFTVSMPGSPSHDTQSVPSAVGPIPIHLYTLTEGYEGYIVGYTVYPDSVFSSSQPEDLMNGAQSGAINNVQGQVTSQRSITIDGYPGREIIGTSPSKNIGFIARLYLVKPRMYMMLYTQYDKDKPASADGKKFLESLQLTGVTHSSSP